MPFSAATEWIRDGLVNSRKDVMARNTLSRSLHDVGLAAWFGGTLANAVSLRTEQRMLALFEMHGGDLLRLDVARAAAIGREMGWTPAKPVTHWRVRKPC